MTRTMRRALVCVLFMLLPMLASAQAWERWPTPAEAGWDTERLARAFAYADSLGTTSLMIVQAGKVVASHGDVSARYSLHSVRKSLLSVLIGQQIERGTLSLDATLGELGIDDVEGLSAAERNARVRDLITARSGVYHPAAYETRGMSANRPARGEHAPGTFWFYNNWDFNALGTIVERAAGSSIFEVFERDVARPIGMEDFRLEDTEYFREPVSQHPAYLFRMSARDLARVGQLYLQDGRWGEEQIVPASWVAESTRPHSSLGVRGGYGYMWWAAERGEHFPALQLPDGTFSARGTGEQTVLVVPAWDLVLVHQTDTQSTAPKPPGRRGAMMHVTEMGRLLRAVLSARLEQD